MKEENTQLESFSAEQVLRLYPQKIETLANEVLNLKEELGEWQEEVDRVVINVTETVIYGETNGKPTYTNEGARKRAIKMTLDRDRQYQGYLISVKERKRVIGQLENRLDRFKYEFRAALILLDREKIRGE